MARRLRRSIVSVVCLSADAICIRLFFPFSRGFFVAALLLYAAAAAIQLAVHELGHLLGGATSGYRLILLQIGPVFLSRERTGRFACSFRLRRGGQCVMAPAVPVTALIGEADGSPGFACPYWRYNFGGIFCNLIACGLGMAGFSFWTGMGRLFCFQLAYSGLIRVIANGFSRMQNGIPTDGYILRLLGRERETRRDYAAYLQVYALCRLGLPVDSGKYKYRRGPGKFDDSLLYYEALGRLLEERKGEDTKGDAHGEAKLQN